MDSTRPRALSVGQTRADRFSGGVLCPGRYQFKRHLCNGAQVPLGKYHDYLLKDGDYVRLGEFELLVSIDKSNDFPPEESAIVAYDGQSPSSAVRKSTANDLGADLDLSELLEPSDQLAVDSGVHPRNAYGQSVAPERAPPPRPAAEDD